MWESNVFASSFVCFLTIQQQKPIRSWNKLLVTILNGLTILKMVEYRLRRLHWESIIKLHPSKCCKNTGGDVWRLQVDHTQYLWHYRTTVWHLWILSDVEYEKDKSLVMVSFVPLLLIAASHGSLHRSSRMGKGWSNVPCFGHHWWWKLGIWIWPTYQATIIPVLFEESVASEKWHEFHADLLFWHWWDNA